MPQAVTPGAALKSQPTRGVPPEPPEASAGKGAEAAGPPGRSQGFARGFRRALLGAAPGLGGSSTMSVRMLEGVSPFSSISSTCSSIGHHTHCAP